MVRCLYEPADQEGYRLDQIINAVLPGPVFRYDIEKPNKGPLWAIIQLVLGHASNTTAAGLSHRPERHGRLHLVQIQGGLGGSYSSSSRE